MPEIIPEYAAIPISLSMRARMARVHRHRALAVYAGPPGIGKTTSARRFVADHPGQALHITMSPGGKTGLKALAAATKVLDSIYELHPHARAAPDRGSRYVRLASEFRRAIYEVFGSAVLDEQDRYVQVGRLTIVIDEAQNLAREAIEQLRYLNDAESNFSPFPVGLVLIGNNEFALEANRYGESVISDAVGSRALEIKQLGYGDLVAEDFRLIIGAKLDFTDEALEAAVAYLMRQRARSLRAASHLCIDLTERAAASGAATIDTATVAAVTGMA